MENGQGRVARELVMSEVGVQEGGRCAATAGTLHMNCVRREKRGHHGRAEQEQQAIRLCESPGKDRVVWHHVPKQLLAHEDGAE